MSEETSNDSEDGSMYVRTRKRSRNFSGDSLKDRRRHSQTLTPLIIPSNNDSVFNWRTRASTHETIQEESKELFESFVYDEIEREELQIPKDVAESSSAISTPAEYQNPAWAKYGRELRLMADEFAKTTERKKIKRRSQEVDMNSVTCNSFTDMCSELFFPADGNSDGFTRERLMVLFFFCSDMAIRSLKEKAVNLFKQFFNWSVRFITEKVSTMVEQYGGWAAVLGTSGRVVSKVVMVGACVVVIICVAKFLFNRFSYKS